MIKHLDAVLIIIAQLAGLGLLRAVRHSRRRHGEQLPARNCYIS
jgi:hypothetical protein